jgi:hypothetical protein
MKAHHDTIRACLARNPEGMTVAELAACTQISPDTFRNSLKSCFGVYIDRWEGPFRGQWRAVYALVAVPEDCPKPEKRNT